MSTAKPFPHAALPGHAEASLASAEDQSTEKLRASAVAAVCCNNRSTTFVDEVNLLIDQSCTGLEPYGYTGDIELEMDVKYVMRKAVHLFFESYKCFCGL